MQTSMRALWLPWAAALTMATSASAVSIDWTFVGDAGNACETQSDRCYGAVAYAYYIGTYEVTNSQYAGFLNAVASTDTNALYNTSMGSGFGGITRSGVSGTYTYSAIAGRGEMPVNYVTFYDSLRFANWLHNGQLTGVQDGTTTENGAYTITSQGIFDNTIERNPGAMVFLPSEDEWYKAAFYDAQSASYFDYPAGSDTQTTCATPTAAANRANCNGVVGDLTNKGSYTGSASPYGTFDQGGNVWEWNEAHNTGAGRRLRGGSFGSTAIALAASNPSDDNPTVAFAGYGFRVASIPEPGTGLLVMAGLFGLAWRRKRCA